MKCKVEVRKMEGTMRLRFLKTQERDLESLVQLWNDGDVMKFVGFPQGLDYNMEKATRWLENINQKENTMHYSIYDKETFLGELFYSYKDGEKAIVDIKLMPGARGKNVGFQGFCFLLDQLFKNTLAEIVTVDPHKDNLKAIRLYEKCGFQYIDILLYEKQVHKVFDLKREQWQNRRIQAIHFVDINRDNYRNVFNLKVSSNQEGYIASNVFSLAQYAFEPEFVPKAIYSEDTPVGFIMWCNKDEDDGLVWIYRLMIDQRYQGLGYGKEAMKQALVHLKSISKEKKIRISFEPENTVARTLYSSMGFVTTGIIDGGEEIYELNF